MVTTNVKSFTDNQIQAWNRLPLDEGIKRARMAAQLEDGDQDMAEKEYRTIREAYDLEQRFGVARRAAGNLNGTVLPVSSSILDLLTPLLEAGGRVTVTLREHKPVLEAQAPASTSDTEPQERSEESPRTRTPYTYYHHGKVVDEPLTKFLRREYPKSRAVGIMNKFKGKKTKVGPWESIQRDKGIREFFKREPKP